MRRGRNERDWGTLIDAIYGVVVEYGTASPRQVANALDLPLQLVAQTMWRSAKNRDRRLLRSVSRGRYAPSVTVQTGTVRARIIAALASATKGLRRREVAKAADANYATVGKYLRILHRERLVTTPQRGLYRYARRLQTREAAE